MGPRVKPDDAEGKSRGRLLAGPDDAVDPGDFGEVEAAVAVGGVEALELDAAGGAAGELLGHDFAGQLVRATTRSPRRMGAAGETTTMSPSRSTGSMLSPAISSAVSVGVADFGQAHLVPAAAHGEAGVIEEALATGLGETDAAAPGAAAGLS